MQWKREYIYWICQVSGWCLAAFSDYVSSQLWDTNFNEYSLSTFIMEVAVGISITHIFRYIIISNQWLQIRFPKLIFYIVPACIVLTLLSIISYTFMGLVSYLFQFQEFHSLTVRDIPENIFLVFYQSILINLMWYLAWTLIYFVYHAFENLQIAKIESIKLEGKFKEIELRQLRSQLNPHFLFNALNSVRALIDENPSKARLSITQLSNILRNSLSVQQFSIIPFHQEMDIVKDYLSLEKVRFEDRLQYNISTTTECDDFMIPPMLIQTLVENAIKHGIGKNIAGGEILINACNINDTLSVEIINTGQLQMESKTKGYGIANTLDRLLLIYGNKASLDLTNLNSNHVSCKLIIKK